METPIKAAIAQERLRQAKQSFNVALCGTAVCALAGTVGIGLVIFGKAQEGAVLTAGGIVPISSCLQFAREANERLDELFDECQKS